MEATAAAADVPTELRRFTFTELHCYTQQRTQEIIQCCRLVHIMLLCQWQVVIKQ